ncbi:acyltransferase [Novosphingobium sp. 9]|uniref:acyltransferase n=1 Tax=Novosphingobium sp. 9 TaxID=2025349 RepID=UPI0021B4F854|nr:acyltransferase [Novosphingobium sp. 9]
MIPSSSPDLTSKRKLSRGQRFLRLLASTLDPRAWAHLFKIVNYYNYSHVQPLRSVRRGEGCAISPDAVFSHAERVVLGERVAIGSRCHIWAGNTRARILLGDDVLLGPEVMITASSYRFHDGSPVSRQAMDEADIIIGRDVWLGTRAIVLPGVTIGDGAVIGAGTLVNRDIPPMAIAVGTPARIVGERRGAAVPPVATSPHAVED